jgi:hypothetical protein
MTLDTSKLEVKHKPTEMSRWVKNISALMTSGAVVFTSLTYDFNTRNDHEYQLVQDNYMIDKKTGRIWRKACIGANCNGAALLWGEYKVVGINGYSYQSFQNDLRQIAEEEKAKKIKSK